MLQVLTNSSTCLGRSVIWVSRSLQWITLTPSFIASRLKVRPSASWRISSASGPCTFRSSSSRSAMSIRPCFVQCEISPGLAPCSMTAVGPGSLPAGGHAADVHVPPVERPLGGVLVRRAGVGVPDLHRRVDVEHPAVVAPLEDFAAVDVPGKVDQQVARREVLRQLRAEILRRDPPLEEADPLGGPRLQRRPSGLRSPRRRCFPGGCGSA